MASPGRSGSERETVRRLVDAAADEFARHGFAATRVRDIVDAAGVNLAAVNYHFGGKQGLYHATLASLAGDALHALPLVPKARIAAEPEQALRTLVVSMMRRYLAQGEASPLARIVAHELLDPTPAFAHVVRSVSQPQWDNLLAIVARLLGPDASEEDVALASLSTASQWTFYLFGRRLFEMQFPNLAADPALIERVGNHVADFSLEAIRSRRERLESAVGSRPAPQAAGEAERALRRQANAGDD